MKTYQRLREWLLKGPYALDKMVVRVYVLSLGVYTPIVLLQPEVLVGRPILWGLVYAATFTVAIWLYLAVVKWMRTL